MESLNLLYQSLELFIPMPTSFLEICEYVKEKLNFKPVFKYFDEENELISVSNEKEFKEAAIFVIKNNKKMIVEDNLREKTSYEDKSCGVINVEKNIQTKVLESVDQSSEIKVNFIDAESYADNEEPLLSIATYSQIPKRETYSKFTGQEYSDKSTNSIKQTSSKASEALLENSYEKTDYESLRKCVKKEAGILKEEIHYVECSECYCKPIYGVMYKCIVCNDFNLCCFCEGKNDHIHSLLKLKKPEKPSDLELLIEKVKKLGFTNTNHIKTLGEKYGCNYLKVVKILLEEN